MIAKHIRIPLIITGVMLITSFVPFIQIVIMFLNGGLLSLFESSSSFVQYLFNGLFSGVMLLLFFKAKGAAPQILTALGFTFFFFPLLSYATDNRIPDDPYFLRILILGIVTGGVLTLVAFLQNKMQK